jgi:phosphatidylglycerol:prolipoprotein diacylglycerol transferase
MALPYPDIPRELFSLPAIKLGGVSLGPFAVRWYALAYIAGIILGWRYALGLVRNTRLWGPARPPVTTTQLDDLVLWITLGVILGGRTGYVLFYMLPLTAGRETLAHDPLEVLRLWHGGMSFHGGALGVGVALIAFARAQRISLLSLADVVAACAPIGLAFGRVANFINGELWGRVTTVPWGMVFCGRHIETYSDGSCIAGPLPRHPSQLYEAILEGAVLFLILRLATHRAHWLTRPGRVTGLFLIGYSLFRIALENVRMPDEGLRNLPLGLTVGMLLSAPMLLGGAFLIWWGLRRAAQPGARDAA